MKDVYLTVRNGVLFYFVAILIGAGMTLPVSFAEKLFVGLIFGLVITLIPHILKFFKLPVNSGSVFLLCIIICFIYFMVMSYVFSLIGINNRLPDMLIFFGFNSGADKLMSLVYATLISSLVVVGFDTLERNA